MQALLPLSFYPTLHPFVAGIHDSLLFCVRTFVALFGLLQDRTCFLFLPKFCGVCLLIMCGVVSFGDVFFALVDQWGEHTVGSTRHRYTLSGAGVVSF